MTATLTSLDTAKTVRFPGRSRRQEIWEAASEDGRWRYVRLEMPGTPWEVTDMFADEVVGQWFGTLREARIWTEHVAESVDPSCVCGPGQPCTCTADSSDAGRDRDYS